jgi:hypothetical protein
MTQMGTTDTQNAARNGAASGIFQPQGLDWGDVVKIILPAVLSTLSTSPQLAPQFKIGGGISIDPFSAQPGSLKPQDIWGDLAKAVGGVLLSTLSTSPQLAPQLKVGGGISIDPLSTAPAALNPQGINLGDLVKTIVPIVLSTLSAIPQVQRAN